MSGWIKFEKDLADDPRFIRMVRKLREASVTPVTQERVIPGIERDSSVFWRTMAIGCLVSLWGYADTHIRQDDTLDLGMHDIDALVGVPGFAKSMPEEWLVAISDERVELPEYQSHNGVIAKKKALTAKRVALHRAHASVTAVTQEGYTNNKSVIDILDQTRPDQRPDQEKIDRKTDLSSSQTRSTSVGRDGDVAGPAFVLESPPVPPPPSGVDPAGGRKRKPKAAIVATDAERHVFDHWREVHQHSRAKLDDKRCKAIREALRNYDESDLCQAITGYRNSPHHMGQNDRKTKYDDIELFLRDAKHIDAGLAFCDAPPLTTGAQRKPPEFHQRLIELYHRTLPALRPVKDWHPERQELLDERIREVKSRGAPADTLEYWENIFGGVADSDYLMGRTKARFKPDLEWLLQPKNFACLIEGKYDNRIPPTTGGAHAYA